MENVVIGLDLKQYFQVGSQLPPMEKVKLVKFLKQILIFSHGMLITFQELIPS